MRKAVLVTANTTVYLLTSVQPEEMIGKTFTLNKDKDSSIKKYLLDSELREFVYCSLSLSKKQDAIITDEGLILDMEFHKGTLKNFRYKLLTAYGIRFIEWFDLFERDVFGNYHIKENVAFY